jgi:hypothetical protein
LVAGTTIDCTSSATLAFMPARFLLRTLLAFSSLLAPGLTHGETASETTTLALLEQLQESDLPDVMLWVIERAAPESSPDTRRRLDFLKGSALVSQSRVAADTEARTELLDEAERSIDAFLASSPADDMAIAAFTQKGSLLVERGRICLALAQRPGADTVALSAQAAAFFDRAIKTLRTAAPAPPGGGKDPPPPAVVPEKIETAEDAVLRSLRDLAAEIERIRLPAKDVRAEYDAKTAELAPFQKEIEKIDADIRQKQVEVPTIQAEIGELQRPPRGRPPTPKEVQDARARVAQLGGRLQAIATEIAALEATKQKPETQLRKIANERAKLSKQLAAAEKPLEKDLEDPLRRQEELRTKLLQTRLMVAEICFERSKAYATGSREWKAALEESQRLNHDLVEKYGKLGVGFVARLNEGRSQALLGKRDAAIATLAPLFTLEPAAGQPLSPLGLTLKTKALGIAMQCWLDEKKYVEVTGPSPFEPEKYRVNPYLRFAMAPVKEGRMTPEVATLKYRTAELLAARAKSLSDKEAGAAKLLESDAYKLAREVSTANRDFAAEARELAAGLGKSLGPVEGDFPAQLADGQAAFRAFQEAQAAAKAAQAAGDAAAAAAAAERVVQARDQALAAMQAALALGEKDATADDAGVNQARSVLAFLHYDAGRFAEAAALGTILVKDHPNAASSRQAARVALASLQALAVKADPDAQTRLRDLAALVITRWNDGPEAADATTLLVNLAIEGHDADALVALVEGMSPAIQRRPELLLRAALGLRQEAERLRKSGGDAGRVAACNATAKRAIDEALPAVEAAGSLPAAPATARVVVSAALARTQMALADGDQPLALTLLSNPVYGPWTVVSSGSDPALAQGPLATSTLTVALSVFVEAQRFDDAQKAMGLLEQAAGTGAEASARLTATYQSLGRSLQERLDQLTTSGGAGAAAQAAPLLAGFESFLDGVAKRDPTTAAQLWVATTYQTLGSGTGGVVPRAKAGQYLDRAATAYGRLLERLGQSGLPEAEAADLRRFEPTIRLKIASLSRERGKWEAAQEQIDSLLADPQRQNWLEAQVEAAELLLAAGRAAKAAGDSADADARLLQAAGGRKTAPVIWGWSGIANKLSRQAFAGTDPKALQARELFFQARLKVAEALLVRAELKSEAAEKAKALQAAETSIAMTRKLYPDLGGPAQQQRFEKLLKAVQTAQGKPAGGFAALDAPAAPTP